MNKGKEVPGGGGGGGGGGCHLNWWMDELPDAGFQSLDPFLPLHRVLGCGGGGVERKRTRRRGAGILKFQPSLKQE